MLDRKLLFTQGLIMILLAVGCGAFGIHPVASSYLMLLSIVFFALAICVRSYTIRIRPMSPVTTSVEEYIRKANEREDFNAALRFVYGLTPADFIRFGRLVTELRYESDQNLLHDFSDHLRGDDESDS